MNFEGKMLIAVLKATQCFPYTLEEVNKAATLPRCICIQLLEKMQNENLIEIINNIIYADSQSRIKIALAAINLGADIQKISTLLSWREFEEITAQALKYNGYTIHKNLYFKHKTNRYEIDIVGCRKPLTICIDCKHWTHTIAPSTLKKIIDEQIQRTQALADSLPNTKLTLDCIQWEKTQFIPAVLSLMPNTGKFYNQVPVVPILSFQDFINQLPFNIENVYQYPKKFVTLTSKFENTHL
ncbi:MAG: NERD domain-containing protein [Nitrososphaerota archaeon]|nr:NERD domain-containing protein [Nitrososphaerota archaeon]